MPESASSVVGSFTPPVVAALDPLALVGDLPPLQYSQIVFGDSDHDGHIEAVMYVNDNLNFQYWVLEHQGNNVYTLQFAGPGLLPYAMCDMDGDGKVDLVGQSGGQVLVLESPDLQSHPSQLVWSSPYLSNTLGNTAVADTDRDGKMEIIHSVNGPNYLLIVENTDDNTYEPEFTLATGAWEHGTKAIGDFDGDGLIEIAFADGSGTLHVVESPANNQWIETWRKNIGITNTHSTVAWPDADGNGRPEVFVTGNGPGSWTTRILEAEGDNSFAVVGTLSYPALAAGHSFNAVGNLDETGPPEFVMSVDNALVVYELVQPGGWAEAQVIPNPVPLEDIIDGVQIYDANQNGRGELFWDHPGAIQSGARTKIWEHPPILPTNVVGSISSAARLSLAPNPCRSVTTVSVPGAGFAAGTLVIFDAAGRVVDRMFTRGTTALQWLPPASGTYFLELRDPHGVPHSRGRVVVVH